MRRNMMLSTAAGWLLLTLVTPVLSLEDDIMTFGSVVKLQHVPSKYFLHSHQISWGSGSGQQSVTAHGSADDRGGLWVVAEGDNDPFKEGGSPVACGTAIRLGHMETSKNLHSHFFSSPLSNQQEVSCFGDGGRGDSGDNWEVVCMAPGAKFWRRGDEVRFKHKDTGRFLQTEAKHRFTQKNCPNCPIVGQQEVFCHQTGGAETVWKAVQGIFIHPRSDEDSGHDEL
ncbi:stromal cell-derived factor 2 [Nannochloropsis gaditana CCMP526]|nr:stromal cell-derived factor 2 [Nannochloropsis gaditana CCMP526]EKU22443.1 stromal cell-derived factor 2 [Nannochloropsis gaditana CCMP526]|eukprot:XP_005853916.1 stromal cell-derived factor 2 [Nannochloropsis gaditana CCMP526]